MTWRSPLGSVTSILTPKERKRGLLVTLLMLVQALLDTVGVASIMPFLAVLGNREIIDTDRRLRWAFEAGGFPSQQAFLLALGVGAFLLVALSASVRIATTYVTMRYVQMRRYSLGARLLQTYLRQPYEFFLNRNSADLSKSVLSEVDTVVDKVISPAMHLVSYGLVALLLGGLLVVLDPLLALATVLVLAATYGTIYLRVRGPLARIGVDRVRANLNRFQAASEVFGGIKDLKVVGREDAYLERFRRPAARYARYQYLQLTLSLAPKYLVEALGVGGILAIALLLVASRPDLGHVLPVLGLYAFGGYRLLPAAQNIYSSVSTLRFGLPAVHALSQDLSGRGRVSQIPTDYSQEPTRRKDVREAIEFDDVAFRYPGANKDALAEIHLVIPARSSVGFVGGTGAGKTTAVDLILGLLTPTRGRILIDGAPLEGPVLPSWQQTIGYVPQVIYLADTSVTENIAFGIEPSRIDHDAVRRAAEVANIHDFIVRDLPDGYETTVGDRGVRLSGGQRQRIGIARALYSDPSVLVLDEATSALDAATERAVLDAVDRLSGEKTIIIIAHRLSTVQRCDQMAIMDGGRLVAVGPAEDLRRTSEFQSLASA